MNRDVTIELTLEKRAKSGGGDRYSGKIKGEPKPFLVYFPQSWTRQSGEPVKKLTMNLEFS